MKRLPVLLLTQGDPAGVGPEVILRALSHPAVKAYCPLVVAERSALEAAAVSCPEASLDQWEFRSSVTRQQLSPGVVTVLDPVARRRPIEPGRSTSADAGGALAALDVGIDLVRRGIADVLLTLPVAKESIARHVRPGFVGHTEYLAEACGLERYGRDYLMAFLAVDLQVALLSTHLPLRAALERVSTAEVVDALRCLDRYAGGRIAVAGLNPHAGEGGLLGSEDERELRPAVDIARCAGIDAYGPESPDSLFARQRRGEFDWVLALYHDQGLIAVKTATFGAATNWTLGLPILRTSVDHGTAFAIAGRGMADDAPLRGVIDTSLGLLSGTLPRGRRTAKKRRDRTARPESSSSGS